MCILWSACSRSRALNISQLTKRLSRIIGRGNNLSSIYTDVHFPLSHFFDTEHFISSLTTACPQIHIYRDQNDLYAFPLAAREIHLVPKNLSNSFRPVVTTTIAAPGNWPSAFHTWLNATESSFSTIRPVLVSFPIQLLQFPLGYDDPALVATFGRIFRFREDIRRLAAAVLYSMNTKYNLNLVVSKPGIQEGKFYGGAFEDRRRRGSSWMAKL